MFKFFSKRSILLFCPILCFFCEHSQEPNYSSIIALYSDRGCWDESITASEKMFQWMGLSVTRINADDIKHAGLDSFLILCIPGGDLYQYAQDLSSQGKEEIISFIQNGGGYIGICGGAYYAGKNVYWRGTKLLMNSLGIFYGTTKGPVDEIFPYPEYGICEIDIADTSHPITQSEANTSFMLYYWGPTFYPETQTEYKILGTYSRTHQPAMLAFEYGLGRVFLIGTHPEIEEDSDRDGVSWGDALDDSGSDWNLMKQAVNWCLEQ